MNVSNIQAESAAYHALLKLQALPIKAAGLEQAQEALKGIERVAWQVQHNCQGGGRLKSHYCKPGLCKTFVRP